MAQVINTNSLSLMAQNNLNKSQSSLGTAIQRLTSGLRINSAKDDAAGLAIANRFTASIRGLTQASRNANDGISLTQTAEGALGEVTENIQRIRELTVQGLSGSNSESDRASIGKEITARLQEIERISETTNFNGVKLLDSDKSMSIQIGDKDGETISINLKALNSAALGLDTLEADFGALAAKLGAAVPTPPTVTAKGTDIAFASAGTPVDVGVTDPGNSNAPAPFTFNEAAATAFAAAIDAGLDKDDVAKVYQVGTGANSQIYVELSAAAASHGGEIFKVDAKFKLSGGKAELDGAPEADKAPLSALDSEILKTGPTDMGALTAVKTGDTFKAADNDDVKADAVLLDTISTTLFGKDAKASGMQIFSTAADDGTLYAVDDSGVMKKFTVADATGAATEVPGFTPTEHEKYQLEDAYFNAAGGTGPVTGGILETLDKALNTVTDFQADLGAVQNRFNSIIANLNTTVINTTEARSRVQDADFSVEVSAMSRANILQQAGISMLAQANQVPQNVLSLLR